MSEADSFELSLSISEPFSLAPLDPSDRSNRDSFTLEEEADLLANEPYDVCSRRKRNRKERKDLYLTNLSIRTKRRSIFLNKFIESQIEIRQTKSALSARRIKKFYENVALKDERKREIWIKANLIRRVLFGPKYNLRFLTAASRIKQKYPWLSLEQSQANVESFKQYRRRIYWIFVDRGMMPKGTLDKSYLSIVPNSSILDEAFIAENENDDASGSEKKGSGSFRHGQCTCSSTKPRPGI